MKKNQIIILLLIASVSQLMAQTTIESVLTEVEKNNSSLSTLQKKLEAEKVGNKTSITPENPAIEFNYLWGNPSVMGNRTDFSISQTIDFPTTYIYKKQLAELKNEQLQFEYEKKKREVFLNTRLICAKLIHSNALIEMLKERVNQAKNIANAYQVQLKSGESNQLEFNKAQLYLLKVENELKSTQIELQNSHSDLALLNGGKAIAFELSTFQNKLLSNNFDDWYQDAEQKNPVLQWLKQELTINEKHVQLSKAMKLPKLQAGYMSEKVVGEQFQGIALGITVPLWENKNKVKYAQLNSAVIESARLDQKIQFYAMLKQLHANAISIEQNLTTYRESFRNYDNSPLLQIAFEKGEISLIEYLYESSMIYENKNQILDLEMGLNKIIAEMNQYLY